MIRDVKLADAQQLTDIFNYYVENSPNTFETILFTEKKWQEKIEFLTQKFPFKVFCENDEILGYCYLSPFRNFTAYNCTAELAIFLDNGKLGKGIGRQLISAILNDEKTKKFHSIISAITVGNESSANLHLKLGFQKVGFFPEVGLKNGSFLGVDFFQYIRE